ncbi:cobyrinate a,c-diamide synthase [Geomobilimonas luticola]|uniref:Cobyrinate a,c-diamide synthase n=1 Tax=Geomobilimonas luticola TaxID=1114878 RepID=A0ABS5SC69_9BACT|nr:cobyrinate a,c-diamide synthase [Geomobilimonas luticola]MBT0652201.1 cobyrinate a,c-diamide synthase [Geomobilimonas luticola]
MKSIIIAAPMSGSGKTTVTLGIMECLKRRGLKVAPFKVGPDYIDPGYHRLVTGRPSINLDGWMCPPDFVRETFLHHASGADISVIEGVMGLFDGVGGVREEGSTAQVAKLTGAPVILVVDARGQARSMAALVKGFAEFDPQVRVAGVIFNNVASENHARILRESVESLVNGPKVVGWLPRESRLAIPSRHLGLLTAEENPLPAEYLDHLAAVTRQHIDLGLIWAMGTSPADRPLPFDTPALAVTQGSSVRIAVARDEAFCFVYEDNLRLLRRAGAEIAFFSPLRDEALPSDIGGIYLPGGYPEVFADALADNGAMKGAILDAIAAGMPLYAECGGFIYLTRGVEDSPPPIPLLNQEGVPGRAGVVDFVGVFPVTTRMLPRRKALGYREIETVADSIIGPTGTIARGHEFHYSEMEEIPAVAERLYRVRRQGVELEPEGYRFRSCLASYIHLHFGSCPEMAAAFVESCRKFKSM